MKANKGFTLIEMVMTGAVLSVLLGVLFYILSSFNRQGDKESRSQDYFRQLSILDLSLKRDIRSSVDITREASGVFTLKVLVPTASGVDTRDVVYWVDPDGWGVDRMENGKTSRFNFRGLMDEGKRFTFNINP